MRTGPEFIPVQTCLSKLALRKSNTERATGIHSTEYLHDMARKVREAPLMNRYQIAESFSKVRQCLDALRSELSEENSPALDRAASAIEVARSISLMSSCGFQSTANEKTAEQIRGVSAALIREKFALRLKTSLEIYSPSNIDPGIGSSLILSIVELVPVELSPQLVSEISSIEYCKAIGVDACTAQCFYIETIVREAFGLSGDAPVVTESHLSANAVAVEVHGKIFRSRKVLSEYHPVRARGAA